MQVGVVVHQILSKPSFYQQYQIQSVIGVNPQSVLSTYNKLNGINIKFLFQIAEQPLQSVGMSFSLLGSKDMKKYELIGSVMVNLGSFQPNMRYQVKLVSKDTKIDCDVTFVFSIEFQDLAITNTLPGKIGFKSFFSRKVIPKMNFRGMINSGVSYKTNCFQDFSGEVNTAMVNWINQHSEVIDVVHIGLRSSNESIEVYDIRGKGLVISGGMNELKYTTIRGNIENTVYFKKKQSNTVIIPQLPQVNNNETIIIQQQEVNGKVIDDVPTFEPPTM